MSVAKTDKSLLIISGILLVFGLVVLSSAGVIEGQSKFSSPQYYLIHQILNGLIPGIVLFLIFSKIKYKFWQKIAVPLFLGSVILLIFVFLPKFSIPLKGAQRWLYLGSFSFQPSEILKLSVIIYFAAWFSKREIRVHQWSHSAAPFFTVLGFVSLLLALQPDVGTLSLIILISLAIYFSAGASMKQLMAVVLIMAILFLGLIYFEPYRLNRILTFFNPSSDIEGRSYHIRQAILGIGSGGIFGVGFGKSQQKINFLPEPVGDSIFVILVEELGLVGAGFLVAMFLALAVKLINIAKYAPDYFSQLLVIGVLFWIVGQAFINIAAVSGLMPLTGIPLPFVSYGGTALAAMLAGLGIVDNISKYSNG